MNKQQFESLNGKAALRPLAVAHALSNQAPRTLAYGYTCARETFHVYLAADGIHRVVYDGHDLLVSHTPESAGLALADCVPDKRLYPEACDYEFCVLLRQAGVSLPFTTFAVERDTKQFHGRCFPELNTKYRGQDFKLPRSAFDAVVADDLFGANAFVEVDVVSGLSGLLHDVGESYLRACVPGVGDPQRAERWLDNLPGSMDLVMSRSGDGLTKLTEEQHSLAVKRVRELVQPLLAELLAR